MIFSRYALLLLHVPKTGGNSLQHKLLPLSDDHKITTRRQDGVDRFEVGGVSPHKHATLAEYAAVVDPDRFRIAITVRDPLERAVSMFYSPHRWYVREEGVWTLKTPVWSMEAFTRLLSWMPSASDFLRIEGRVREPDFVLRQETLERDL